MPENLERWLAAQEAMREADRAAIRDAARVNLRAAQGEDWETDETGNTPTGATSRTVRRRSAALLDSAAGKLDPENHGKQAGRGATVNFTGNQVAVQIVVPDGLRSMFASEGVGRPAAPPTGVPGAAPTSLAGVRKTGLPAACYDSSYAGHAQSSGA